MRFFWLPLSTTKFRGVPFSHICEWKRRSSAFDSSGSSSWIYVVATVAVGSTSMVCLPLSAAVALGSKSESRSDSKNLILATNNCFEWHSSVLCQGFYEICTTSQCPSFSFHPLSFLVAGTGCPFLFFCFWPGFPLPCFYGRFTGPESHLFFCRNFSSILTAYQ